MIMYLKGEILDHDRYGILYEGNVLYLKRGGD